jgi:hypothetical protein
MGARLVPGFCGGVARQAFFDHGGTLDGVAFSKCWLRQWNKYSEARRKNCFHFAFLLYPQFAAEQGFCP